MYKKLSNSSEVSSDRDKRLEIIKFIEKYRTAYITRDIQTVDIMFAEDALIIVGRRIKRKKLSADMVTYHKFKNEPDYKYLKFTKKEYIRRQRKIFESQEDISLDFSSFDITKKNDVSVYGVQMRQNYASTTYSDEGYLFLLIDFQQHDPLIYVRVWQPKAWSKDELYKLGNFKIHR